MRTKIQILILLILIPLCGIGIYVYGITHPELVSKYGGGPNLSQLVMSILTYLYVALTAILVYSIFQDRRRERRPYIIVDVDCSKHESWLIIRNIGKMPAKELDIHISPELPTMTGIELSKSIFKSPIAFFPPGKVFKSFIDKSFNLLAEGNSKKYSVTLKYRWDGQKRKIKEEYDIDLSCFVGRTFNRRNIEGIESWSIGKLWKKALREYLEDGLRISKSPEDSVGDN